MGHDQTQDLDQTQYLIVPGWHGSEPEHWQSHWQRVLPSAHRVEQRDWANPNRVDWLLALDEKIRELKGQQIVLIAHSLGCVTIALWAQYASTSQLRRIAGALLVAPADVERDGVPEALQHFGPVPLGRLPFPSVLVGSTDDSAASAERAILFGRAWGSHVSVLNNAGHINVRSGHTTWETGFRYLYQLQLRITQHQGARNQINTTIEEALPISSAALAASLTRVAGLSPLRMAL